MKSALLPKVLNSLFLLALAATGVSLTWLGGHLFLLGGSPWYVLAGAGMLASAAFGVRHRAASIWIYWALLAVTLIWALWEVGLDGWALAARLSMPFCLGLWQLTPWYRAHVGIQRPLPGQRGLWCGLALGAVVAPGALFLADHDPRAVDPTYGPAPAGAADGEWRTYGNDQGSSRWSKLAQITPANVGDLVPIWTYHMGPLPSKAIGTLEVNPLQIGGRLYVCTGANDVIALDAETGKELWRYRSTAVAGDAFWFTCRGVTYFKVPGVEGPCAERIYTATVTATLIAIDAVSGRRCTQFGQDGGVDLLQGMGPVDRGYYFVTSPPALVGGKLVVGGLVKDGQKTNEPPGVVRAFDAVTGAFSWAFDTGRPDFHDSPGPAQHYTLGTPNSWAPMGADEELGLVFVPTGNATPDYYGGHRTANDDRFSSSLVALDVQSGAIRWSFQTTHHDVWDYDVASAPTSIDLPDGVKGLIVPTKRGEIFLLDRRTGRPVRPVEERRVPRGAVPGERLAPTQPFSPGLPSFIGRRPSEKAMWGLTPIDQAMCRIRFRQARFEGTMTPLGTDRPTLIWPGSQGAVDWGGISIDKNRLVMIVNSNQISNIGRLIPRATADAMGIVPSSALHMGPIPQMGVPYAAWVEPFLSPLSVPCEQPPYGTISAVDLSSGTLIWSKRLGTSRDSGPWGLPTWLPIAMGVPNIGGSIVTGGGLIFIGATQDRYLRAFETTTGRELWKGRLPAGAQATPTTYWSTKSGRQFVVIAAGGHVGIRSSGGDALIAYALPRP